MNNQNQHITKSTTIDLQDGIYRYVYTEGLQIGSRINAVSIEAEWLFIRCLAISDDFGIFPADPAKCLYKAAPRRSGEVSEDRIKELLDELERNNLIVCYTTLDGDTYATFLDAPPNAKRPNGRRISRYPQPQLDDLILSDHEFGYIRVKSMNPEDPGESGGNRVNPGESGGIRVNPGESGGIRGNPGESGGIRGNPGDPGGIISNRKIIKNCSSSNSLTCCIGDVNNNGETARAVQNHAAAADILDSEFNFKTKKAAILAWGIDNPKAGNLAKTYPGSVLEIHLLAIKAHTRNGIKNKPGMHAKLLSDGEQPVHKSRLIHGKDVKTLIDSGLITHIGKYPVSSDNTKYWQGKLSAHYQDLNESVVFDKSLLTHDSIICRDLSLPKKEGATT